jgi:hypothetical protein
MRLPRPLVPKRGEPPISEKEKRTRTAKVIQYVHDVIADTPPYKHHYKQTEVWAKVQKQEIKDRIAFYVGHLNTLIEWWEQSGKFGVLSTPEQKKAYLRVRKQLKALKAALYDHHGGLREDLALSDWNYFPMSDKVFDYWIQVASKNLPPSGGKWDFAEHFAADVAAGVFSAHAHAVTPSKADLAYVASIICGRKIKPRSRAFRSLAKRGTT